IAIGNIVYRPGISPFELVTTDTVRRLALFFRSISKEIQREFANPKLVQVLEFPVLFLGAKPADTPAFYNFMNYADFGLGTWHPKGGMFRVVAGLKTLAESFGVKFYTEAEAEHIQVIDGKAISICVNGNREFADIFLSSSDYHHTEQLIPRKYRQYAETFWQKKTFAPSALLFYVGFDRPVQKLVHHNLCFDTDFKKHAEAIYDQPEWPEAPLFYASFPSKT